MTDEALLTAVAARDESAFEELYSRLEADVSRHVRGMLRDDAAAGDVLQEVFLRVWQRADQWNGFGSARAWVLRIATNLSLNHLRSTRRRREQPLERPPDPHDEEDEALEPGWMIDEAAVRPDDYTQRRQQQRLLSGMIDALPEEKREVFRLIHDAELEVREVAEQLGIPEGTVKSRMHHARRRLAQQWRTLDDTGQ